MIKEREPLNMCEVKEALGSLNGGDKIKDVGVFIKKFNKVVPANAKKLKAELEKLGLLKIKPADIAKMIDTLPEDAAELNKIFVEVTLDADETNKILETIKKNKSKK